MKKRIALALALMLFCLALPLTAQADIIWEPIGNAFYEKHRDDCVYIDRGYVAPAGVKGYVDPADPIARWTCEEETSLYIGHSYTFGTDNEWGVTDIRLGNSNSFTTLWIDLDTLIPIYSSADFLRDHEDEIADYAGQLGVLEPKDDEMILWRYPGSGVVTTTFPMANGNDWEPSSAYTDIEGNVWVYYAYLAGMDGWVYANDIYSETPVLLKDVEEAHTRIEAGRQLVQEEDKPKSRSLLPALGALTLVHLAAVVVIIVLFRKRKQK